MCGVSLGVGTQAAAKPYEKKSGGRAESWDGDSQEFGGLARMIADVDSRGLT